MVVVMEVEGEELESEVGVGCVEAGLGLFEWEDIILVTFESDVRRSDCIQCRWQSLRDGDAGGFCVLAFFSDRGRLRKILGAKVEMEKVVKMVVVELTVHLEMAVLV